MILHENVFDFLCTRVTEITYFSWLNFFYTFHNVLGNHSGFFKNKWVNWIQVIKLRTNYINLGYSNPIFFSIDF